MELGFLFRNFVESVEVIIMSLMLNLQTLSSPFKN